MTAWSDFFNELIFGAGSWVGFIGLATLMILISLKAKIMGLVFCLVSTLISVYCFSNIAVNSDLMWVAIMYSLLAPIMLWIGVKDFF